MNTKRLFAVALAALVVATGAAAAVPGNASNGNAPTDDQREAGPPADLPGPVPDFVGDIHDTIGEFMNGSIDSLGDEVSAIAGNGDGGSGDAS